MSKFLLQSLAAAALVALVSMPAQAHLVTYYATLTGAAEDPPNLSPATGMAAVVIDDENSTMRVIANFSGLLGTVTVAHIHCCTAVAGVGNVGTATMIPSFPGFPAGVLSGSYDQTFDMSLGSSWRPGFVTANGGTTATAFSALMLGLDNGKAYFNLHTTFRPAGEIRGFFAVSEPGSLTLAAAALGLAGATLRRRSA